MASKQPDNFVCEHCGETIPMADVSSHYLLSGILGCVIVPKMQNQKALNAQFNRLRSNNTFELNESCTYVPSTPVVWPEPRPIPVTIVEIFAIVDENGKLVAKKYRVRDVSGNEFSANKAELIKAKAI